MIPRTARRCRTRLGAAILAALAVAAGAACRFPVSEASSVNFTAVPIAAEGGSDRRGVIAGRVAGARDGQLIVIFAKSSAGVWWVQPLTVEPFTQIQTDATWRSEIHLGVEYAALLVGPGYRPPPTTEALPKPGGDVIAVATTPGTGTFEAAPVEHLTFSGYEWEIRQTPSDRGGANDYASANAWTDADGMLHLKLRQDQGRWTSAEVILRRSLGYGTYVFVVRDVSQMDPAAAMGMLTWDDQGADQNHRELDVEISHWGDLSVANAQYVVQPYYVAANVARFSAPAGRLTHSLRWEPGRASFRTLRGKSAAAAETVISQHDFTSGVPVPGSETVRINLYYFRYAPKPPQGDVEVVVERCQYLP
jgi:hypothetical protein